MDDNIKALLEYLNLTAKGEFIVTPTSFYLVEGSWMLTPEAYGVRVTTTSGTHSVRDMKAYALLMRVIGDSKYIIPYMNDVIESLIRRVTNCSMNSFNLIYDEDGVSVEVYASLVRKVDSDEQGGNMCSNRTWRINTKTKTVHQYTPNQWMLESTTWNVEDYYLDIGGCLILLNVINNR